MSDEPDWVAVFRKAIMQFDADISAFLSSNPDATEACSALVAAHTAKAELAVAYDSLSGAVSHIMDQQGEVLLDDGSKVEKKWGSDRKGWQHKELAGVVANRIIQSSIDIDTGEIIYTQEEIIGKLLDFLQPSYWRVKELQKLGINADMYCEVGDIKSSIIIRKAK